MATSEKAIKIIPKRSHSKQNAPLGSNNGRSNANPITVDDISVTDRGIVRVKKGKVYMDLYKEDATKSYPFWSPVMIKDEFGNLVEMVRHSDEDDIVKSNYVNNQGDNNRPIEKNYWKDGKPSRYNYPDGT